MIRELHINNYKSLHDIHLEVGRFNVLIGANGCGKSNLLEAIALAGAAAADKLDNEFLAPRGIRVTEPRLMRSAFDVESLVESIKIGVRYEGSDLIENYTLINSNQPYEEWSRLEYENTSAGFITFMTKRYYNNGDSIKKKEGIKIVADELKCDENKAIQLIEHYIIFNENNNMRNFIVFCPENTILRNFREEGQIEPLGINGEGLLKLLKVIQLKSPEQLQEIQNSLQLFDWFSELDIPKALNHYEDSVTITDRYLAIAFDQRSANEGFLFVLFYIALMVSDKTPKIFAIDNIDVALNPKLCTKLITELIRLAKKYDKQVFVTTHNPAILDGIDLGDDEQRLLVVSRNKQGHTRFKRIELKDKPKSSTRAKLSRLFEKADGSLSKEEVLNQFDNSEEPIKLSEAFLRGYLGGLPKGF